MVVELLVTVENAEVVDIGFVKNIFLDIVIVARANNNGRRLVRTRRECTRT